MDAYDKMLEKIQNNSGNKLKHIPAPLLKHVLAPQWWKKYTPYFNKLDTSSFLIPKKSIDL
ncbi:MAG: hypothetical protein WKG06_04550 [Segetibacter sp.]